ncbi:MAG: dhbC [Acidimicrobiaceae bacterium]|nr:dhbC [Acidimicrobiaceae bacterium]
MTDLAGAEDLVWASAEVRPEVVAAARRFAFVEGRVLEREGAALYAWGDAARLELPLGVDDLRGVRSVRDFLGRIRPFESPHTESTGDRTTPGGPIALGALAFDPKGWSELIVPRMVVVVNGDHRHAIGIGSKQHVAAMLDDFPFAVGAEAPTPRPSDEPPDRFDLASARPHEDFRRRVSVAVEAVRAGNLDKVVLVREVIVTANRPVRQHHLLERLRALHPSCFAFAIDGFVGASPELLVRRRGAQVASQPLAGTVARSGDPEEDRHLAAALLASSKERAEHRIVVDAIVATLTPLCSSLDAPDVPHLLALRNVAHLATRVTGSLANPLEGAPMPSALDLAAALHPTPAVGGWPREEAMNYLRKNEDVDRGRFAGPVGWVGSDGDGEWWIGIRSTLLEGPTARLLAGVGIVADSDPAAELAETQLKLQALLAAAVRP